MNDNKGFNNRDLVQLRKIKFFPAIRPSTFILKDHPVSHRHLMSQKVIHFESKIFQSAVNFYRKKPSFYTSGPPSSFNRPLQVLFDCCLLIRKQCFRRKLSETRLMPDKLFGNIHFWLEKDQEVFVLKYLELCFWVP